MTAIERMVMAKVVTRGLINLEDTWDQVVKLRVSDAELEDLFARDSEKVRLDYLPVRAYSFEVEVGDEISDADVVERFERDPDQYRIAEQRRVTFALLDTEAIRDTLEIGDERLRRSYDENIEEYTIREQVRARHILIRVPPGGDQAESDAARDRAEAALERAESRWPGSGLVLPRHPKELFALAGPDARPEPSDIGPVTDDESTCHRTPVRRPLLLRWEEVPRAGNFTGLGERPSV